MRLHGECVLDPLGLRPRRLVALTVLRDRSGITQQALSATLTLDRANIVGLLNDLEGAGLVERIRSPLDRRRHLVQLTERGRPAWPQRSVPSRRRRTRSFPLSAPPNGSGCMRCFSVRRLRTVRTVRSPSRRTEAPRRTSTRCHENIGCPASRVRTRGRGGWWRCVGRADRGGGRAGRSATEALTTGLHQRGG
ncbi:MarR family transcriptional regulator [Rhodococcus opacus]